MNDNEKTAAWYDYCDYLRDWASEHNSPEHYGMTPACFDEWLWNEHWEECPFGGDIKDDCKDCADSAEFHYLDGFCVYRSEVST